MKRLAFLALTVIISVATPAVLPRDSPPDIPPSPPRHWTFSVPEWQPVQSGRFREMSRAERYASRFDDRWAIRAAVRAMKLPKDAKLGRLIANLLIKLGKYQKTPDDDAYRESIVDGFEAIGVTVEVGSCSFERGVAKEDRGTTIMVEEGK